MTLYISACLRKLESAPTLAAGTKAVFNLAMEPFALPGDAGWPLGGLFTPPANREEGGACRGCAAACVLRAWRGGVAQRTTCVFWRCVLLTSLCVRRADSLRAYLKQAREETGARLVTRCYTAEGTPNKFWMAFSKRKFMNKELS